MRKKAVKNKWRLIPSMSHIGKVSHLYFMNDGNGVRFKFKEVVIPSKGLLTFTYEGKGGSGIKKKFTRKRTPALLAKYRVYKSKIR